MVVDEKGREILEEAGFEKFREAIIDSLMRKISLKGRYGSDIRPLIEETLREEAFIDFVRKLSKIIERDTTISKKSCSKTAGVLVEEEIAEDIKDILKGQLKEKKVLKKSEVDSKGEKFRLWKEAGFRRFLGEEPERLRDLAKVFKEHQILSYTVFTGVGLLVISALLFGSVYRALVVGLTLTTFPGSSVSTKLANVLGAVGGILIFFTSLTVLLEHILLIEKRNEYIKELARKYFESR